MKKELPEADFFEENSYFSGRHEIFIIKGNSMLPALRTGDCVLIDPELEPEIGDIVLFRHPFIQNLKAVKRLAGITPEGNCIVLGDNPAESTDSRSYGAIRPEDVLGVAVCRFDGN